MSLWAACGSSIWTNQRPAVTSLHSPAAISFSGAPPNRCGGCSESCWLPRLLFPLSSKMIEQLGELQFEAAEQPSAVQRASRRNSFEFLRRRINCSRATAQIDDPDQLHAIGEIVLDSPLQLRRQDPIGDFRDELGDDAGRCFAGRNIAAECSGRTEGDRRNAHQMLAQPIKTFGPRDHAKFFRLDVLLQRTE